MASRVDVGHAIISNGQIECIYCHVTERAGRMIRWIRDRAGIEVRDCRCPECRRTWTQYIYK